jgi:hypothetical protein
VWGYLGFTGVKCNELLLRIIAAPALPARSAFGLSQAALSTLAGSRLIFGDQSMKGFTFSWIFVLPMVLSAVLGVAVLGQVMEDTGPSSITHCLSRRQLQLQKVSRLRPDDTSKLKIQIWGFIRCSKKDCRDRFEKLVLKKQTFL